MPTRCTRRTTLLGSLSLLLACTPRGEDARTRSGPAPLLVASDSSPVSGGSQALTVYADGLVLRSVRPCMGEALAGGQALRSAQADAPTLARLRELVARQDVLDARATYEEYGVLDGGSTVLVAGPQPRRISIYNDPSDLPEGPRALQAEAHRLHAWVERDGVDAFTGPRAVLVRHTRSFIAVHHADELTVFADGTLDYRVTAGEFPGREHDYPYPAVHIANIDPAELAPLRTALARLGESPPEQQQKPWWGEQQARSATHHTLELANSQPRRELGTADQLTPAFERVTVETRLLRANFDAPADEPSLAGR